jgi:hypothetical protein
VHSYIWKDREVVSDQLRTIHARYSVVIRSGFMQSVYIALQRRTEHGLGEEKDRFLFYRLYSQLCTLHHAMGSIAVAYHEKALLEVGALHE